MFEKRFPIQEGDRLELAEMLGHVSVTAWDEGEILIGLKDGGEQDLTVDETETGLRVSAREDCQIRAPATVPLTVEHAVRNLDVQGIHHVETEAVRGNLGLADASLARCGVVNGNLTTTAVGSLELDDAVYGNARLEGSGAAALQDVRGNCQAKGLSRLQTGRIAGNLQAREIVGQLTGDKVGGNAFLKGVGGAVSLDKVGGNLVAKGLTAGAKVSKIGGNLVLNGEIGLGCSYFFRAGGNAVLRLGEGANAHLSLSARGMIQTSVALEDQEQEGKTLQGTLGTGGAEIVVEAGGNCLLGGQGPVIGDELRQEISQQVEESLHLAEESLRAIDFEAIGQQVSAEMERAMFQLQAKLEDVDWEHLGRRTQKSIERAMKRLQRDIDRLTEKAARRQEKLERMAERASRHQEKLERMHSRGTATPSGGGADNTGEEPKLEEERLAILRMVEEGKISLAEAETLLDALD